MDESIAISSAISILFQKIHIPTTDDRRESRRGRKDGRKDGREQSREESEGGGEDREEGREDELVVEDIHDDEEIAITPTPLREQSSDLLPTVATDRESRRESEREGHERERRGEGRDIALSPNSIAKLSSSSSGAP
jgi:hypothetical protein